MSEAIRSARCRPVLNLWRASANLATLSVLALGVMAIALSAQLTVVLGLMALATTLDGADGLLARRAGGPTPMGARLDLMADFIAFGLAPVVFMVRRSSAPDPTLWVLLGLFLSAALFRLLRSCLQYARKNPVGYTGMPMPACGWLLLGLGLAMPPAATIVLIVLALSALAVSRLAYPSPEYMWRWLQQLVLVVLFFVVPLAVISWRYAVLLLAASYALYPLVKKLARPA